MRTGHSGLAPAAALLCAIWLAPALAQDPGEGAEAPPSVEEASAAAVEGPLAPTIALPERPLEPVEARETADDTVQLEDMVVTATKRTEDVREIPASITSLGGEELEQRGAQDTADIVKLVPGVNLTSTGDTPPRITIRGISSDIGTGPTTGVLFGNVSFTETYSPVVSLDPNPFDLASVDVLKGPQGTLFGASALNGAVRYVPEAPQFGISEFKYFGQYTSIEQGDAALTYGAVANFPLFSDTVAVRIMGFDRTGPGYIDNLRTGVEDTNSVDQQGARVLVGWQPSGSWNVLLTGLWQNTLLEDVGISDTRDGQLQTNNRPRPSPNETEYWMADLAVTWTGEWAEFVSDTSYVDKRGHNFFDATSRNIGSGILPVVAQEYAGESPTMAQEFRLVSIDNGSRWKWTAGVFAYQQELRNLLRVPLATDFLDLTTIVDLLAAVNPALAALFSATGEPLVVGTEGDVRVREIALFGDVTRNFGEDESVEVSLGGRLYKTTSGGTNTQTGLTALALHGMVPYVLEDGVEERGFNPKASVLWHINDDILTYGLVSKGFRVGGVQFGVTTPLSATQAPDTFKSDTLWNYELGVRTQFLDNTLRLDLTAFHVDWKEPQSLQPDASGLVLYVDNVGGVHSTGADLSLQYIFPWGTMLKAGGSYAKTVTATDFTISDGTVVPTGSPWPLAPEWQAAATLMHTVPVGDWMLGGMATYTAIGPTIPFFTGEEIFDYRQLDLQLNLSNPMIPWLPQVSLIANNVTDERGVTNAFSSGVPSDDLAAREYYYITPRSLILRISGRFGG